MYKQVDAVYEISPTSGKPRSRRLSSPPIRFVANNGDTASWRDGAPQKLAYPRIPRGWHHQPCTRTWWPIAREPSPSRESPLINEATMQHGTAGISRRRRRRCVRTGERSEVDPSYYAA